MMIVLIFLLVFSGSSSSSPGNAQADLLNRLHSTNEQERVDAFFELFDNDLAMTGRLAALILGKTPEQICSILGEPTEVEILEDGRDVWAKVHYAFNTLPRKLIDRDPLAREKWTYFPTVVFRNGRCVRPGELFAKEIADNGGLRQVMPIDPRWKKTTQWPCPVTGDRSKRPPN